MLLWFANRGTGVVLVALFTLSTVLGIVATARAGTPRWPRFATQSLHRNVSLLSAAMLVVHIATAVLDNFVDLDWYDAIYPTPGKYADKHFVPLLLGSLALNLTIAVVLTSLVRARLNHRLWRGIHLFAYVSWASGVLHGFLIGTDARTTWSLLVTIASVGAVGIAAVVRLATFAHERRLHADATGTLDVIS